MNSRPLIAASLSNLGAAERELGRLEAALEHMRAGLAHHRALGQPAEIGMDLADLVVAYLRAGDIERAVETAGELLGLYAEAPERMMHPQFILWAAAQARRAQGERDEAQALLTRAHTVLAEQLAGIPEAESRAAAAGLPFNREILSAYTGGEWPPHPLPES
jgi:tetratricopeptide (TPR) repeat protein